MNKIRNAFYRCSMRKYSTIVPHEKVSGLRNLLKRDLHKYKVSTLPLSFVAARIEEESIVPDPFRAIVTSPEAFYISGDNVQLASSTQHSDYLMVQKYLVSVPSEGVAFDAFPLVASKGLSWLEQFNDILTLDLEKGRIVPVAVEGENAFILALKKVLFTAPETGLGVEQLVEALQRHTENANPVDHGFDSLAYALMAVNDLHYIHDEKVVPVAWGAVMTKVAAQISEEGVLQHDLLRLMKKYLPMFDGQDSLPGVQICDWVETRFGHLLQVRRSATDKSSIIYRPTRCMTQHEPRSCSSDCKDLLESCYQIGNKNNALTGYTDLEVLTQYMRPRPGDYGAASWLNLVDSNTEVDFQVRMVAREDAKASRVSLFVDGTSISPSEAKMVLREKLSLSKYAVVIQTTVRHEDSEFHSPQDIIVNSFLDSEHVIGAHISELQQAAEQESDIVLVCGESKSESMLANIKELPFRPQQKIIVATPTAIVDASIN